MLTNQSTKVQLGSRFHLCYTDLMHLGTYTQQFNAILKKELAHRTKDFHSVLRDTFLNHIVDHVSVITLSGGKRIRPYLVNLMYRTAGGGERDAIIRAELAVELFQMFCLIHDDVMDRAGKRHSQLTINAFTNTALKEAAVDRDATEALHVGNSQAILAGDLLLGWASQLIHTLPAALNERQAEVVEIFYTTYAQVIAGQMLDVDATTRKVVDDDFIEHKTFLKTASYSVIGPLKLGRALATADTRFDTFIEIFGRSVGLAYQMQDDTFSWQSDSTDASKNHDLDISAKQHTFIRQLLVNHTDSGIQEKLMEIESKRPVNLKALHLLAKKSGVLKDAQAKIGAEFETAQSILDAAKFSPSIKKEWQDLLDLVRSRTY